MKIKFTILLSVVFVIALSSNGLSQATRIVLFEEGTSAFCGPCAASNPIFDAWLLNNSANAQAIKYHPNFGPDPMYLANPTQIDQRIAYMGMFAWPTVDCDGLHHDCCWPFSASCFSSFLSQRLAVTTPVSITVTDMRIPGDSIKSTIVINLSSNLPSGDYKLRVMSVEGHVHYTSPPGSNGETDFHQVFRWAYPNMTGVSAPTTAGTYTYYYTYKRLSTWADTSIYTVALVQNDVNKEVINSGKGHYTPTNIAGNNSEVPAEFKLHQNYPNPFNPVTKISYDIPKSGIVSLKVYDVLGNEVSSLVDGFIPAGEYDYDFNASDLSSGVYYYKLVAGEYNSTKKMILLK
ncbi:T9SS type A sorting domain-containing protein [Bacteroidota bacterium]